MLEEFGRDRKKRYDSLMAKSIFTEVDFGGWADVYHNKISFFAINNFVRLWTSTEVNHLYVYDLTLSKKHRSAKLSNNGVRDADSVRCVKDADETK